MKKIFITISLIILTALAAVSWARAETPPAFNNLPGDQEFLRAVNLTKGVASYVDPVMVEADDEIRVIIYYHNTASNDDGSAGEAAKNVRIKIILPDKPSETNFVQGQLWADNATLISGTVVNGVEVGAPGLTINSPEGSVTLSYIPHSVNWFPNGLTDPQTLPFNQNGQEIFTETGLNLGDIQGCWQYAGFVSLKLKAASAGVSFSRAKSAFNETKNKDATTIKAQAGDIIRYNLKTTNTGSIAGQTEIKDDLADILVYADLVDLNGGAMFGSIISFGNPTIAPGQTDQSSFKVKIKSPVSDSGDFLMTNIYGNKIEVPVEPPPPEGAPILKIDKMVRNKTKNTTFQNGVIGNPGDLLEFQIVIQNFHGSSPARQLIIKDILDSRLEYQNGSGRLEIIGQSRTLPIAIFSNNGFLVLDPNPSLGPIGSGDSLKIFFESKISQSTVHDSQLINKACTSANQFAEICDQVVVINQAPTSQSPIVSDQNQPPIVRFPTGEPEGIGQPPQAPGRIPQTGPAETLAIVFGLSASAVTGSQYLRSKKALLKASMKKIIS